MRKLTSVLTALAMSVGVISTGAVPVYAAPLVPPSIETSNNIQKVNEDARVLRRYPRYGNREWRGDRGYRGERYRYNGYRGYRGDRYWYNGHRGYRYYRPGYRYYNDAWFPLAAFGGGLIIGNAISQPAPIYRTGSGSHAQWCFDRYRSYRAYDNTYQPYGGPRRQCISPYY